ncbi:MAG: ZIP family metal transporter [Candidatus Aureabacteria bacterium]|nr:ZIP family metal transporter [Candidatus Auribacterota bacterium]
MNFIWALLASVLVSIISLIGIVTLLLNQKQIDKILILLVGFGAGGLIGGAFLHLLPEGLEKIQDYHLTFLIVIFGFILFFILEKYFYWRHCHNGKCDIHVFTYMNLIGDAIHNFVDGLIIGGSFFTDFHLGVVTTAAIILHEIPQELGDFGVLLYGGFSRKKALYFNLLSAMTAVLGTLIGYLFSTYMTAFANLMLPFAAGGFIYIAACDLIPQLHKQPDIKQAVLSLICFILGILLMLLIKTGHS